jgi:hypothetical protein
MLELENAFERSHYLEEYQEMGLSLSITQK